VSSKRERRRAPATRGRCAMPSTPPGFFTKRRAARTTGRICTAFSAGQSAWRKKPSWGSSSGRASWFCRSRWPAHSVDSTRDLERSDASFRPIPVGLVLSHTFAAACPSIRLQTTIQSVAIC
jgi:hypothetical protein